MTQHKRKQYKTMIYDIDGTLINTLDMNMRPLQKIIEEETGEAWPYEKVLQFASLPGMKVMEIFDFKHKDTVYQRWVEAVNAYEGGATVYDGIRDVLDAYQNKGVIQAVVSSKTKAQYDIDVVQKGLGHYFETAVLAEDTDQHKPHPQPILECLKRLGISHKDALYIGDTLSDYQAAQAAHVDFGYAVWGSVSSVGIDNPTYVFHSVDELTPD
ncbi:hydrolase [Erysipelothrix larvae]|uniref:Hydrolase n=1 Tax=Erysipelothrix larvae TaxID=1514105 RepID=A0A0X8GYX8_9FIRM|nr:HAD-IA family hydrolase [Erysipelothrix larvae]AMC92977.1 hydrolase [Erysipelothrix larvae]